MRLSKWLTCAAAALALSMAGVVSAGLISVNFSENSANQGFAGGQMIGPLATDSANWNNTNGQPVLKAGSLSALKDSTGAATAADLTWSSSNCWWNADAISDDEHKMSVGYLDDGSPGVRITVTNVPYEQYRVYLLVGSDQDGSTTYASRDFKVNGAWVLGGTDPVTSFPAYNTINAAKAATGSYWVEADGVTRGNYLVATTSGSTLEIEGQPRAGSVRGSITAFMIEQVPEPGSLLVLVGGIGMLLARRRGHC